MYSALAELEQTYGEAIDEFLRPIPALMEADLKQQIAMAKKFREYLSQFLR